MSDLTPLVLSTGLSAFFGALCAFVFVRFGDVLTRLFERKNRHYRALVRMDTMWNEYYDEIHVMLCTIDNIASEFEKAKQANAPLVTPERLQPIPCEYETRYDLANLDLSDDVFTFQRRLRHLNGDIVTAERHHDFVQTLFADDRVSPVKYCDDLGVYVDKLLQLRTVGQNLLGHSVAVLARIRLLLERDRTVFHRLFLLVHRIRYGRRLRAKLQQQEAIVRDEIAKREAKGERHIAKLADEPQKARKKDSGNG